jgi:hypothetical protein
MSVLLTVTTLLTLGLRSIVLEDPVPAEETLNVLVGSFGIGVEPPV